MTTPEPSEVQYVTNVACTVRVGGVPVRVPASTHLPAGVSDEEIARLLRFNVIREYTPEPEPVAEPEATAVTAAVRRPRKKATVEETEPIDEE